MDAGPVNAWIAILAAVLGLVAIYLRYYVKAAISQMSATIIELITDRLDTLRDSLHNEVALLRTDMVTREVFELRLERLEERIAEAKATAEDDR